MNKPLWYAAKLLEFAGLVVVLAGLALSIAHGLGEQGLASMQAELRGLIVGGSLFAAGWMLEARLGRR